MLPSRGIIRIHENVESEEGMDRCKTAAIMNDIPRPKETGRLKLIQVSLRVLAALPLPSLIAKYICPLLCRTQFGQSLKLPI